MAAKQIREILDTIRRVHVNLSEQLARKKNGETDEENARLISYLQQHEVNVGRLLEQADGQTRETMLNTYIRYYPLEIEKKLLAKVEGFEATKEAEPLELVLDLKQDVVRLLTASLNHIVSPETENLIQRLRDLEDSQLKSYARRSVERAQG